MSISHTECEPTFRTEENYLLVKCALCTKDMVLSEGSVIFGSNWYHESCFSNILNSKQIFAKESKTQNYMKNIRTD